jgi:alpha-N-arabinofuranosidase
VRGWRKDVVGALKALKVPLVRWPAAASPTSTTGATASAARKRPVKVNTHWGGVGEQRGRHARVLRPGEQLGAEAYVNGNLGTGTPQEMPSGSNT